MQALLQGAYPSDKTTIAFIDPTSVIQYGVGFDNRPLAGDSRPDCAFFINPAKAFAKLPSTAYPIIAIDYVLFYGNNNGVHTADKPRT